MLWKAFEGYKCNLIFVFLYYHYQHICHLNGPEVLTSSKDKANLFARKFSANSTLERNRRLVGITDETDTVHKSLVEKLRIVIEDKDKIISSMSDC